MRTRTLLTLLTVALLVVPGFASAAVAGSQTGDATTGPGQMAIAPGTNFQIDTDDGTDLEVVDVRSNATVGTTGVVAITIENTGSETATDTQLTLASRSGEVTFGKANTASRYVDDWKPDERRTVRYRLTATDAATAGTYPFTLSTSDGQDQTGSTTVGIDVAPEQSFAIGDVTSTLRVGDDGRLEGVVTNTGDRTADNVVIVWSGEQRNVNPTETEYAVGTLEPGESAEFDFDVEVSDGARSGPRQFSLVANYGDGQGNQRTSDSMAVHAQVAPASDEFDVEILDANVSAGGSSTVEMRLTNVANETLTDISAKLFASDPISTDDDEAFVKRLEPGASTTLLFSVGAGGGALEKPYPLSMDFQYDEPDGDTVTSGTYTVPVQVTRSNGGGPILAIGGAIVLAVIGLGAFLRFR